MKNKTLIYQWIFGVLSTLFIIFTTLIFYFKGHINSGEIEFTKLGAYGDFIGGSLGTILSIVAVILVYRTYISQKEELSMSRNLLEQQQFENTFFNMLKVHQELKSVISFNTEDVIISDYKPILLENSKIINEGKVVIGKHFFNIASLDFKRFFRHFPHENPEYFVSPELDEKLEKDGFGITFIEPTIRDNIKEIKYKYDIFYENYSPYFGDYFRNLYHILRFISKKKEEDLKNIKKICSVLKIKKKYKQYSDILQSQMNFS